jgi:16S rRNA (cytosine967-C5)-methyltransferase
MTDPTKSQGVAGPGRLADVIDQLWQRIRVEWRFASSELSNAFRTHRELGSADRRAVAETLYGMIRQHRRVDFALEGAGPLGAGDHRDRLRRLAYLIVEAGLDPEVAREQAREIDWDHVARVDRRIAAERSEVRRLALSASLPDWLAAELLKLPDGAALAAALDQRAPMTARVNTLRASRDALAAELAAEGLETSPGALSPTALHFDTRTNLFALPQFRAGLFEAQDEGSQLCAELVAPPRLKKSGARVVDFCAGAGGKTLAIAAAMGNKGRIVAADVSFKKLAELRRRARRAGVDNAQVVELEADPLAPFPPGLARLEARAHRVLVDAPCSGVGALRRNPESKWRLKESDLERFPALQLEICERALGLVAPGGRLIYATCTVLPAENQDVVNALTRRHPGLEVVSPVEIWGRDRAAALTDASEKFLSLRPDRHGTDGFFAAVLRKR